MSIIYPYFSCQSPQINFVAPFQNVYNNMRALTSSLIQSRIIQRNLVYIIGLSPELIKIEQKLKSYEYFGQYGKIIKLVVNKNKTYNTNGPNGPSYTCFITYSTEAESSLAILSMDNYTIDNHEIKANYGTTKYCINFLKNAQCRNKECIFLHKLADEKDIVSREQMNNDKDIFPQQRLMAIELSKILTDKKYKELYELRDIKTVFPNGFSVYKKELIIRYIKEKKVGVSLNLKSTEFKLEKIENKKEISTKEKEKETKLNDDKQIIIKETQNQNKIIDEGKTLFKNYFDFKNNLNSLFKSSQKSRFNFVKTDINNPEKSQLVPSQINDFLTQQFMRHSNMFQEEQNFLTDYYFSLKQNSLDSNESWSSLISTLKKWNDVYENSEEDNFNKFNTY
jgi:CCR4-NOT transcription complex subunit 4